VNTTALQPPAFNPRERAPGLAECLKDYPPSIFGEKLYQSIELMERYSIDLAIEVADKLNLLEQLTHWAGANELCQKLEFQPRFTLAIAWILERLIETGCIEARAGADFRLYRIRNLPWKPQLERLHAIGLEIDPANAATLDLLKQAAALYPVVVRGEQNAEQNLFGASGISLWLNYFHNANLTYAVNNWVAAVLAARCMVTQPKLRILELGAGAGSATETLLGWFGERALLPRLERYLITEPHAFFRRRNERELSGRYRTLSLEWGALDINVPWSTQGVASGEFDMVYAVNVMHVAKDLLFTLEEARSALAPTGWLVIGECLRPYPNQPIYPELMFQILESFTDVRIDPVFRPNPGFLTAAEWVNALGCAGFERAEVAPDLDRIRQLYPHFFTGAIAGRAAAVQ
jgi:SAM-dependent methyltransferase